jgi:hypothetical protein
MKSQVAQEHEGGGKTPAPAMPKAASTEELPVVSEAPAVEDDEDVFKEIPTVANRSNPTADPGGAEAGESLTEGKHDGAGTYRILRPTTSDVIETPAPTKVDPSAARRVVIGAARKPR